MERHSHKLHDYATSLIKISEPKSSPIRLLLPTIPEACDNRLVPLVIIILDDISGIIPALQPGHHH